MTQIWSGFTLAGFHVLPLELQLHLINSAEDSIQSQREATMKMIFMKYRLRTPRLGEKWGSIFHNGGSMFYLAPRSHQCPTLLESQDKIWFLGDQLLVEEEQYGEKNKQTKFSQMSCCSFVLCLSMVRIDR